MKTRLSHKELWDKLPNSFINRAEETVAYLRDECLYGEIADCGEDNPLKHIIENSLNLKITTIDWDFNYPVGIVKQYDTILCFEVLEHLMNPLVFLNALKRCLKDNGVIYLSTPYQRPQVLKAIHHYHEIPTDRLFWLFDEAGLRSEGGVKITIAGNWYNHIGGIRPMLRYFQKTRLFKLKKI